MVHLTERATMLILFCWFYAIIWSIPPFIGWGRYIPEGILDSCSFDYLTRDDRVKNKISKSIYTICGIFV